MPEAARVPEEKPPLVYLWFQNPEIHRLLGFALDSGFGCEVRSFTLPQEALKALSERAPALFVIDGHPPEAEALLQAAGICGCRVAIHHTKKPTFGDGPGVAAVFNEPELLPGISGLLAELGARPRNPALSPCFPYFRVGVPLLLETNPLVADAFIKLSELKYVKLFHKGASFGPEDVAKYHSSKKIDYFYIRQEDSEALIAKLNETLERLLRSVPLPLSVSTPVSQATIETVHSLVNQVGFTPGVQKLVKQNVELVLQEMYAAPSLGSILRNMEIDREKFIAAHSHMLAEVSCALAIAMKWDSELSFKKLTMAALLHDMCLTNQKLARIRDAREFAERRSEFGPGALEELRSHPKRASVLVSGMSEVPADVDKIIAQHHELPMGTGFPDALTHVHIHPLASLMIVAHDVVDWVLDRPGVAPDMEAFIGEHAEKYRTGNFRKILKALYSLQP